MRDPSLRIAMQAGREPIEPDLSINQLADKVARERAEALAAKLTAAETTGGIAVEAVTSVEAPAPEAEVTEAKNRKSRKGGAFGGALKRRIEATDSAAKRAATNEHDIYLLEPASLRHELMGVRSGDQVYVLRYGRKDSRAVTLTPSEHGDLTFSPRIHAQRLGGRVLAATEDRPATDRHARKTEVTEQGLRKQHEKAVARLEVLTTDETVFSNLLKYMASPGYAHVDQEAIDGLMAHAEGVFVQMFEAITTNHKAGTERVESLKAALDYLLTASDEKGDYKRTFGYWRAMCLLGKHWTRLKQRAFRNVKASIAEEYKTRFHSELDVA